jgi:hypothetical protein
MGRPRNSTFLIKKAKNMGGVANQSATTIASFIAGHQVNVEWLLWLATTTDSDLSR